MNERTAFAKQTAGKSNAVFLGIYVEEISPCKYFKDEIQKVKCPAVSSYDIKRKYKLIELLHTHAISRYGENFYEEIFDPVNYAKRLGYAVE